MAQIAACGQLPHTVAFRILSPAQASLELDGNENGKDTHQKHVATWTELAAEKTPGLVWRHQRTIHSYILRSFLCVPSRGQSPLSNGQSGPPMSSCHASHHPFPDSWFPILLQRHPSWLDPAVSWFPWQRAGNEQNVRSATVGLFSRVFISPGWTDVMLVFF
jgi:hypothetical protein